MLNPQQIAAFANLKKISRHALMEYCQHELLDSFFKQKESENFSFMGGTAIRIVYGGQRFSEDLDFDTQNLNIFDSILQQVLTDMTQKGFSLNFRLVHKDVYHCYIKFPEILFKLGLSPHYDEKLLIKIDASMEKNLVSNSYLLNNYSIFRNIKVTPAETILAKKLLTILERKRPKGRDLYDVIWLWGMTKPDEGYLIKTANKNLPAILKKIRAYTVELDLLAMQQEVKLFLLNTTDADRILLFPKYIDQKLKSISKTKYT